MPEPSAANHSLPSPGCEAHIQRRWLLAFGIAIPGAYALFYVLTWNGVGPKDFDQFLVFHQLQYWNRELFGLAKQWTPLMCAGLPMAGEPQIPVLSLSMLLTYAMGPLVGIKLATIAYLAAGWLGAYLYAGLWRDDRLTRVLAASLFIGNGFFVYRIAVGHIDFVPFLALPLALWALHRILLWRRHGSLPLQALRAAAVAMAFGVGIAMAIDGSPVAIIHLLFWVCLYALVLSYHARSFAPCLILCCAIVVAAVLDAAYVWPMLRAQAEFPRHTADTFTDPLGLLVHAVLPLRGKITHGSGKGHELTVFIGPILALLIWRYRAKLFATLPRELWKPLLAVSVVSVLLGMGSLRHLHIPHWLSPFDLLRPLPGFRSIGVTARYWGFLALPLSLLGAVALRQFLAEASAKQVTLWLSLALMLQLGAQAEAFWSQWKHARPYEKTTLSDYFHGRNESLSYVLAPQRRFQGEFITPTRAVANCYNMDDFIHAPIKPGNDTVIATTDYDASNAAMTASTSDTPATEFDMPSWNHFQLRSPLLSGDGIRVVVLNQAWNSHWSAEGCEVLRDPDNRLALSCSRRRWREGVDLTFDNDMSDAGAITSLRASPPLLLLLSASVLLLGVRRPLMTALPKRAAQ